MSGGGRTVVKIADLAVVKASAGELVTHALGSCIGLTVFDPVVGVGGMLHFMLPAPGKKDGAGLDIGPFPYCSTAVPALFRAAYELGADRERLIVCAAGGAEMLGADSVRRVGDRNRTMLRKLLWKNNLSLHAESTGGNQSRNLSLDMATGRVSMTTAGESTTLWNPAAAQI